MKSGRFSSFLWLVPGCYAAAQLVATFGHFCGFYDDPIPLVSAQFIRAGALPQFDFHVVYPALWPWVLAQLFGVFGATILVPRLLAGGLLVGLLAVYGGVFRKREMLPLAALAVVGGIGWFLTMPAWPGWALAVAGLLIYYRNPERALWAGALCGIAMLVRVNFGLYVVAAVVLESGFRREGRRFLGAAALANALFYLAMYGVQAPQGFFRVIQAVQDAMSHRFIEVGFTFWEGVRVAFPAGWFLVRVAFAEKRVAWQAVVAGAVCVGALALGGFGPRIALWMPALEIAAVLVLERFVFRLDRVEMGGLLFYACLLHYYFSRADYGHVAPVTATMALLLPLLAVRVAAGWPLLVAAAVFFGLPSVGLAVAEFGDGWRVLREGQVFSGEADAVRVAKAGAGSPWGVVYRGDDEARAVALVRAQTSPGERIYSGVADHSRIFVNDVRVYWLAGRLPGTGYFHMDAGVVSRDEVQREIVGDLERNRVNWAVLQEERSDAGDVTFRKTLRQGSTRLDEYLRGQFTEQARFGAFVVMRRNGR